VVSPSTGESSTYGFSFTSNVIWVRALAVRSYFLPAMTTPMFVSTFGLVDSIQMTFGNAAGITKYDWAAPLN
jgi:hypothetical protein